MFGGDRVTVFMTVLYCMFGGDRVTVFMTVLYCMDEKRCFQRGMAVGPGYDIRRDSNNQTRQGQR